MKLADRMERIGTETAFEAAARALVDRLLGDRAHCFNELIQFLVSH